MPSTRHYKKPLYNLLDDLVPVVLIADQPTILITPKEFPANTMPNSSPM